MQSKPLFASQIFFSIYSRILICAAFSKFCQIHPTAFPSLRFTAAQHQAVFPQIAIFLVVPYFRMFSTRKQIRCYLPIYLLRNILRWREDASHSLGGQVNKVRNNLWPNVLSAPQRIGGQPDLLRDQSSPGCIVILSWRDIVPAISVTRCSCHLGNAQDIKKVSGIPA